MNKAGLIVAAGMLLCVLCLSRFAVAEICPAVACDCGSLPKSEWKATCQDYELAIKKKCAANNDRPVDYCSIHGPSARPLPLAVKLADIAVMNPDEIKQLHMGMEQVYKTAHWDLKRFKAMISTVYFKEGLAIAKELDSNIDSMFSTQRTVAVGWHVEGKDRQAIAAWKNYSEQSELLANSLADYADQLWQKHNVEVDASAKKGYKVIAFKTWRMAGKVYEMAAYAYSGAEKNQKAAQTWAKGANVAQALLNAKREINAKASHINYFQHQAASRLHRASYYFSLDGKGEQALSTLAQANDISPSKELLALIELEDASEAEELTNL